MSKPLHSKLAQASIDGKQVEVLHVRVPHTGQAGREHSILLLHEALGSVSYWREFPKKLALATSSDVLCYSRPGHGHSEGPLEIRDNDHYMRQTRIVIPALLDLFHIENPVLYGHSEGAGIAMLFAAQHSHVEALILESPHVVPERSSYLHIQRLAAAYPGSKLRERLALYHRDADAVFRSWFEWASALPEGNHLPHGLLSKIACPVLVIQGANDEFGITAHLQALQASIPHLDWELLADTGHLPHRERTDVLLVRVAKFLKQAHSPAHQRKTLTASTTL